MIKQAIDQAVRGEDLSEPMMMEAMEEIMEGRATPAQIAALLIALRLKGESIAEISGAARVMRAKAVTVTSARRQRGETLVDVVGTGGDGKGTFNVSTTAAFVAAGAGAVVAKHGNRAVSGKSGSADLIESLGISLDLGPEQVGQCIDQVGIGFMFAPLHHPALRHAMGPRREIGQRTIFNLLGPLTNPARPQTMMVGVYDPALTSPLAEVLGRLGVERALVVHGHDGCDEITITGPTRISRLEAGRVSELTVTPEDLGLARAQTADILGGDTETCRKQALAVLQGEPGPKRDMVLMNAGAALVAAGLAPDLQAGVAAAAESVDSGAALAKVRRLAGLSAGFQSPRAAEA